MSPRSGTVGVSSICGFTQLSDIMLAEMLLVVSRLNVVFFFFSLLDDFQHPLEQPLEDNSLKQRLQRFSLVKTVYKRARKFRQRALKRFQISQ